MEEKEGEEGAEEDAMTAKGFPRRWIKQNKQKKKKEIKYENKFGNPSPTRRHQRAYLNKSAF